MPAVRTMICEVCGGEFKSRGFAMHQSACKRDFLQREEDQAALRDLQLPACMSTVKVYVLLKPTDVSQRLRMVSACLIFAMRLATITLSSKVTVRSLCT